MKCLYRCRAVEALPSWGGEERHSCYLAAMKLRFSALIVVMWLFWPLMSCFADSDNLAEIIQKAEQGDVEAQVTLGNKYHYGQGVPKSASKAIKWFRKAAEQGSARGQSDLGEMYIWDSRLPNYPEGVKWLRLADETETDDIAVFIEDELGDIYLNGRDGIPQDYAEAEKWFRKAANRDYGAVDPQCRLGAMYLAGEGMVIDYVEALKWILISKDDCAAACLVLDECKNIQEEVSKERIVNFIENKMTKEQISESEHRVALWRNAHDQLGVVK